MSPRACLLVVGVLCVSALALPAQTVTLTTTGASTQMANPTVTQYVAGSMVQATPIGYTLRLNSGRASCTYTVLVQVKSATATLGGTKPVSDLQWATTGGYTAMTTTFVTVATHTLTTTSTTASGNITLKILLNWTDTATSYAGTGLGFQVSATTSGGSC